MDNNPIGFHPSDKEKIAYLLHKMNGKPLPCDDFISIPTIDIYGDDEPWEVFDESDDREIYFFSKLKEVWKPINARIVGKGSWQIHKKKSCIFDSRNEVIGFLNKFVYWSECNREQAGKWILEEYSLADEFKNCIKDEYNDYMFCSLKENPEFVSDDDQEMRTLKFFDQILAENIFPACSDDQTVLDLNLRL